MKKYYTVLLALVLTGCTEDIDMKPNERKEVVVNCVLTNSDLQTLTLNYSAPVGQNSYEEVKSATVTLYENDAPIGNFTRTGYAQWEISHKAKFEAEYKLQIEIDGRPTITATTKMPENLLGITPLRNLDSYNTKHFNQHRPLDPCWVFAVDKGKDTTMAKVVIEKSFRLMEFIGTNYDKTDNFNLTSFERPNATTLTHWIYIRMISNQYPQQFYLEGIPVQGIVTFRAVSDEYDQYLKTSIHKMMVYDSFDDPTQWLDESTIYSNITNGVGIFGAYVDLSINYNMFMHW